MAPSTLTRASDATDLRGGPCQGEQHSNWFLVKQAFQMVREEALDRIVEDKYSLGPAENPQSWSTARVLVSNCRTGPPAK